MFLPPAFTVFLIHVFPFLFKVKNNSEPIWTGCGMPFGTLNPSQPWATICVAVCHRGTALGPRQWHTTIRLSIHPSVHLLSCRRKCQKLSGRATRPKKVCSNQLTRPCCYIKSQNYIISDILSTLPFLNVGGGSISLGWIVMKGQVENVYLSSMNSCR